MWRGTCHAALGEGPRRAHTGSCARTARGQWVWPGRATVGRRPADTMPPVPRPPEAAMRAVPAGAAGSGALLRVWARGTPSGSGGGGDLVKGPVGVASAPGATTGAAGQAPLRGALTSDGGPPTAAGLPLA